MTCDDWTNRIMTRGTGLCNKLLWTNEKLTCGLDCKLGPKGLICKIIKDKDQMQKNNKIEFKKCNLK